MDTDLLPIKAALADLTDAELHALIAASNGAPRIAYGLLVWIEGSCDWELNRRGGHDYELLPPEAAIDPSEDAVSIDVTYAMRASFAAGDMAGAVLTFLDTLLELLTGGGRKHRRHSTCRKSGDERTLSYFVPKPRPKYHTNAENVAAESAVLATSAVEMRATSDS
jgi:hypothetical protein